MKIISTVSQPSLGDIQVTYTNSEHDCGIWLENNVYSINDYILSFDTESLSQSDNIEVLILSTSLATLVIHVTYFEFSDSKDSTTGCLRKLLLDSRITFVGVEISGDVALVTAKLKEGLFASEADIISDQSRESGSMKTHVKVCDCSRLAQSYFKKNPPGPSKLGLAGLTQFLYPEVKNWKPKNWLGFRQKQQLFQWTNNPLQSWQIEYCALDGWNGRLVYDSLVSKITSELLDACTQTVLVTY